MAHTQNSATGRDAIDMDLAVMRRVEEEAQAYGKLGLLSELAPDLITDWRNRLDTQPKRFISCKPTQRRHNPDQDRISTSCEFKFVLIYEPEPPSCFTKLRTLKRQ